MASAFSLLVVAYGWHKLTGSFHPSLIEVGDFSFSKTREIAMAPEDIVETRVALAQPYRYLGKGAHLFAFVSRDGRYVIKFVKRKEPWIRMFCRLLRDAVRFRGIYVDRTVLPRSVEGLSASAAFAYERLKPFTETLFLHFNPTEDLKVVLSVRSGIGRLFRLDLDRLQFIVQRRAVPVADYLLTLRKANCLSEAERAVSDLLALTERRARLGYRDKDPRLLRNFGFVDGRAVQWDIGGFGPDTPTNMDRYYYAEESRVMEETLRKWLIGHYPELLPFVKEAFCRLRKNQVFDGKGFTDTCSCDSIRTISLSPTSTK
ncbi:MAG: hypothetical protein OXF02_00970 [Simkaniaceae bacterium]|nr:hypothetical protein [Simkaniaceae bacterium]